jgi:hypothetical protein
MTRPAHLCVSLEDDVGKSVEAQGPTNWPLLLRLGGGDESAHKSTPAGGRLVCRKNCFLSQPRL